MHPGGRPTKFTKETIDRLIYAISKGSPYELACNYAGVDYSTFRVWMIEGENHVSEAKTEFSEKIKKTVGATALRWLEKIEEAAEAGTWTAAAWKLERKHHKHFSQNAAVLELNERVDNLEGSKNESKDGQESSQKDDKEV